MADHILTLDEIWAARDIEERTVDVPQWGGQVRIRTFSKRQADRMRAQATTKDPYTGKESTDNGMLEALLFCEGVVEPQLTTDDYERLQEKSAVAVSLILRAILDASGLSELAVQEASKSPKNGHGPTLRVSLGEGVGDDAGGVAATDVGE